LMSFQQGTDLSLAISYTNPPRRYIRLTNSTQI
jgi:hypothetical protein